MQRWGVTAAGTPRFRCASCTTSSTLKRPDTVQRNTHAGKIAWITSKQSLTQQAKKQGIHRTTLSRRFKKIPDTPRLVPPSPTTQVVLVLDGTRVRRGCVVLIAYDVVTEQPLGWSFVAWEKYTHWFALLAGLKEKYHVIALVSDGQKGLKKAIRELFPEAKHQRCVAHVVRLSLALLTKYPQSAAGRDVRALILTLTAVRTPKAAEHWRTTFFTLKATHAAFLKERSKNPITNRWWYTHRALRAVVSLITNALDDLFHHCVDRRIPNTSNHVEGGINAPLKNIRQQHRGITKAQMELLVSQYLYNRRKKKPTRNAT